MRKQLLFVLILTFGAVLSSSAQSTHSSVLFIHHSTFATPDVASSASFHPTIAQLEFEQYYRESGSGKYDRAEHKRNVGIGLTAAGGTCLIGGAALLGVGVAGIKNDINGYGNDMSPLAHAAEIAFGVIFALAGTGMTIPGAILLAKGQHDMKKYKASQSVN